MPDFQICGDPSRRHDFILLFDVVDGNPNGDPDAGNMPRVDPETMQGLVTDVCLKRKVRNYVAQTQAGKEGYGIYVNDQGLALNTLHQNAYDEVPAIKSTGKKQNRGEIETVRERMCRRFFDVRSFGAVMTTGVNAGQVRGPIQMTFARSADPVVPLDISITRVAITKPEDAAVVQGDDSQGKTTEMGRKPMVPYGLYVDHGFFSAPLAAQTGVSREDLELYWMALINMWDLDRSAARGLMACRGLYVFTHGSSIGSTPAHKLFDKLELRLKSGVTAPRSYSDYVVSLNKEMPDGVTLTTLTEG